MERRARGYRLVVVFAVVFVVLAGILGWRWWTGRAIERATDVATAELRAGWRPVDLDELAKRYAASSTNAELADDFFPGTSAGQSFATTFDTAGRVDASYVLSTWGRERCLYLRVTGPVPNRVQFQQRDGDCHS